MTIKVASLDAENTFTEPLAVTSNDKVDISISGTFVGTVTVQRRREEVGSNAWMDLPTTWTAPTQSVTEPHGSKWEYRIGIKAGNFTSGTAIVALASR